MEAPARTDVVSVYPNPSGSEILFNFSSFDLSKDQIGLVIYDRMGKEVLNFPAIQESIFTLKKELPAGVYFYNVLKDKRNADSGKLIIVK
jgi:hypothetical protein